ncbi:MAG: flagellar hook-associated protein 3 [Spirochaetaceae bacterium]|jgi:flagellar hook-associated protein 3 FlgL|nr:flagellar hook-associated protein 3 [Spirochaetaceae bacterium]
MERISTAMPNNDMSFYLRRRERDIAHIQNKIASQTRLPELADDPIGASHAVRYASHLTRLEQFEQNTHIAREHYNHLDGFLGEAVDIVQKLRELAVKGANGVWTADDTAMMGIEVNELLKELVSIANASGPNGKYLFTGDRALTEPFRIVEGSVERIGEDAPLRVEYRGAGATRSIEIADGAEAALDVPGSRAFWAERMQIASARDATSYQVAEGNTAIYVDGVEIPLSAGDDVNAIIAKINDSSAPVKAYLDVETQGLALEGADPHLVTLEDRAGSTVLQDLGLTRGNSVQGAANWAPDARVSGGSLFDVAIALRDALLRGDHNYVGGQALGAVDGALGNLNTQRNVVGSRHERAEIVWARHNTQIGNVTASLDREAGLDLASAALELGMMDMAHRATLQSAARILPPTLLDFLR